MPMAKQRKAVIVRPARRWITLGEVPAVPFKSNMRVHNKRADIKILAPFYDGGIGLGELILTGLETPAFIPADQYMNTGVKTSNVQPTTTALLPEAQTPSVPAEAPKKNYLPWAVGIAAVGGTIYFFAMRKK